VKPFTLSLSAEENRSGKQKWKAVNAHAVLMLKCPALLLYANQGRSWLRALILYVFYGGE